VRAMRSYKMPEWVRVSIGTKDQNERFIAELKNLDAAGLVQHAVAAA